MIILSVFLTGFYFANGQNKNSTVQEQVSYKISRASGEIKVDGWLTDDGWQNAGTVSGFWMSFPEDSRVADADIQTQVKLTYDNQFLYIGAICHGTDNYVIQTLKRDNKLQDGDAFGIVIDPVNERTNGFVFGVNPLGVQTELLITGQTGRRQVLEPGRMPPGLNVAWDNKWLAEVQNFPGHFVIEMAIPFKTLRFENNKTMWGINFFRIDSKTNSIHTWSPVPIEFTEYDLGYTGELVWDKAPEKSKSNISVIPYALGDVHRDFQSGKPAVAKFQAGADGKVAITSCLNFDLTVNPNFSQVEIDEQVTNLTLFNVQLPEKRLFFLENSDIFEDFGIPPMRPFLSRKIGLDEKGNPIPIIYGARLSGNISNDMRIGLMNLQTREKGDFLAQNYTAFAFHRKLMARSVIKGYLYNRQAIKPENEDYNRNAGLEFVYRSADSRFQTFAGYSKSFSPDVIKKNYFYSSGIGYDTRKISAYTNLAGVGENYIADMGFFRGQQYYDAVRDTFVRIGMNHSFSRFTYTMYPKSGGKIISHEIGGMNILGFSEDFSLQARNTDINYLLKFANTAMLGVAASFNFVDLLYPFSFTDGVPLPTEEYLYSYGRISFTRDQRKLFSFNSGALYGGFYNGTRAQLMAGIKYRVQPWGNFAVNFEFNDLQFPDPYGNARFFNITPRIDFNFSKELFWTTFMQWETQGDNFNINSRLQWRFQPMSDIYLVYTDNYSIDDRVPKYRSVAVKINYWLNL